MLNGPSSIAATASSRQTTTSKARAGAAAEDAATQSSNRPVSCIATVIATAPASPVTPSHTAARRPPASRVPTAAPTASPAMNTPTIPLNANVVGPTSNASTRVHTT